MSDACYVLCAVLCWHWPGAPTLLLTTGGIWCAVQPQETKVETDAAENEKDSTTEKTNKEGGDGGGGDTSVATVSPTSEGESDANNKTLENGSNDESLNDSKAPAADEANKKPKKPKKKWSFRSLSFSKKDKQKPAKKEKDEERVNGECEKVPEEVSDVFRNECVTVRDELTLGGNNVLLWFI
uniref:Uncharacterized protein n=1 Tax=Anopheles minimus TaxID=112268 RepID=A0A182VTY5_9DIPT